MDKMEILRHVDHTILTQTCTWEQVQKICDEGLHFCTYVFLPAMCAGRPLICRAGSLFVR